MNGTWSGTCLNGPYDGQQLAHFAKRMAIVEPVFGFHMDINRVLVKERTIGAYVYDDKGELWIWEPV